MPFWRNVRFWLHRKLPFQLLYVSRDIERVPTTLHYSLKSTATQLFVQQLVRTNIKESINIPHYWPSPVDTPHKGLMMRKASWCNDVILIYLATIDPSFYTTSTQHVVIDFMRAVEIFSSTQFPSHYRDIRFAQDFRTTGTCEKSNAEIVCSGVFQTIHQGSPLCPSHITLTGPVRAVPGLFWTKIAHPLTGPVRAPCGTVRILPPRWVPLSFNACIISLRTPYGFRNGKQHKLVTRKIVPWRHHAMSVRRGLRPSKGIFQANVVWTINVTWSHHRLVISGLNKINFTHILPTNG